MLYRNEIQSHLDILNDFDSKFFCNFKFHLNLTFFESTPSTCHTTKLTKDDNKFNPQYIFVNPAINQIGPWHLLKTKLSIISTIRKLYSIYFQHFKSRKMIWASVMMNMWPKPKGQFTCLHRNPPQNCLHRDDSDGYDEKVGVSYVQDRPQE